MTTEVLRSSYRPGGWFGIFGESATVLLPPSEKARVAALWELVDEGAGFDEVLDGLLSAGLRDLPGFVLISPAEQGVKVVLRGPAVAAFVAGGEMVQLAGSSETTWVERTLSDVTQLFVQVEPTEDVGEDFVITSGLVRVARVEQPPYVAEEALAEDDSTATDSVAGPVAEPVDSEPALAAAEPEPVVEEPLAAEPEPVVEEPLAGEPVEDFTAEEPVAEATADDAAAGVPVSDDHLEQPQWAVVPAAAPMPDPVPAYQEPPAPDHLADEYVTEDLGTPLGVEEQLPEVVDPIADAFAPAAPFESYAPPASPLAPDQEGAAWAAPEAGVGPGQAATVARLLFSSGQVVDVVGPVLIGRAPEPRRINPAEQPQLVVVPSPHQEISSTHLEVRPGVGADHGAAVVTDLGSTNGTVLVQPGLPPEDLQPGLAVQLLPGAIIDLGDGLTIQVTSG